MGELDTSFAVEAQRMHLMHICSQLLLLSAQQSGLTKVRQIKAASEEDPSARVVAATCNNISTE